MKKYATCRQWIKVGDEKNLHGKIMGEDYI